MLLEDILDLLPISKLGPSSKTSMKDTDSKIVQSEPQAYVRYHSYLRND